MAAHIRTQLRTALIARLTGLTATAARVFQNRMEMLSDAELPALVVMNDTDHVANRAIGSQAAPHARLELHTIAFKVRAAAKANSALDDALDEMCKEVEVAIASDIFMGGLTDDARLMSTAHSFDAQGERLIGVADMIWEFDAWYGNTTPDVRA